VSDDRLAGIERLLSIHAEETRTRLDIQQEKQDRTITMLGELATQLAELSRSDEQQWHAISDLRRSVRDLAVRVNTLETKPKRARRPRKK
jgi:hypothetical protein